MQSDGLDPLDNVKKAIDASNDKIYNLQDSLIENKNRLNAILGIGTKLEKAHRTGSRLVGSGVPRCPSNDSKADSETDRLKPCAVCKSLQCEKDDLVKKVSQLEQSLADKQKRVEHDRNNK